MPDKTTITAHIDQLMDMKAKHPEVAVAFQNLINHLRHERRLLILAESKLQQSCRVKTTFSPNLKIARA